MHIYWLVWAVGERMVAHWAQPQEREVGHKDVVTVQNIRRRNEPEQQRGSG
jgi:hypothetical protein